MRALNPAPRRRPGPNLIRIGYLPESGWWEARSGSSHGMGPSVEDALRGLCRIRRTVGSGWRRVVLDVRPRCPG